MDEHTDEPTYRTVRSIDEANCFFIQNHRDPCLCMAMDGSQVVAACFPDARTFFEAHPSARSPYTGRSL